jgi:hypothetical protein
MKKLIVLFCVIILSSRGINAQNFITDNEEKGSFPLVSNTLNTTIYTDTKEDWLVQKAASLLQQDIEKVTGKKLSVLNNLEQAGSNCIIIGSIDQSSVIRQLISEKKINADSVRGKWETFKLQVVNHPFKGIDKALVIAGSDKRGTAFGVFELSRQMGVSPWYWWADVPVKKMNTIFVKNGAFLYGPPSVKYRGIFINDEAPAFSGWTKEKFGGVNHLVYEKIFELLLRLKANYLWPAMWGNAFNDDDTLNPVLADKYGIVMGTSHHEPMLRAQQEWKRYGKGVWNYQTNDSVLRQFWRKGIQNMGTHESIVTIGMRGDGDEPMTQGTAISLLEKIVTDQRKIITEVTHKDASATPQDWALYKEVQDYYDKGMRVPDDVTLLLCDDNWGNIRKLPKLEEPKRKGGYGIYYHFDYVGGPRNYKWINTNNISRVWEQMHLAYEYGVDNIWIVNVGDLKPMELPTSFFLDYAWDTKKWNEKNLPDYYTQWAYEQFDKSYGKKIGAIIEKYSQLSAIRKPELLDDNTFSLTNYNEADRVTHTWEQLQADAEKVNLEIPAAYRNAYFELVLHPVKAFSNLVQLYTTIGHNRFAATNHQAIANNFADKARQLFINDSLLSFQYNHIANGKWNHMMDQTHIGYTYWQQPPVNKMPQVKYITTDSVAGEMTLSKRKNSTALSLVPKGVKGSAFYEKNGYVSVEAAHFSKAIAVNGLDWRIIPGIGRTASGVSIFPVNALSQTLSTKSPQLQYEIYTYDSATIKINTYFSPTLDFHNTGGLKCAVSIDNEQPQIININEGQNNIGTWGKWVADNIIIKTTKHSISHPGKHIIKYWMIDSGIILQKIVADMGGLLPSYLGPAETKFSK